jgi:hypothetical protein
MARPGPNHPRPTTDHRQQPNGHPLWASRRRGVFRSK